MSHDPTEAKLSYFREDTLLHAFHTLFHKVYAQLTPRYFLIILPNLHIYFSKNNPNPVFLRPSELFYYMHNEFLKRYAIERKVLEIPDIVALDIDLLHKSLGPGYEAGWWSWDGLGGRKDDCDFTKVCKKRGCFKHKYGESHTRKHYENVLSSMETSNSIEEFGTVVNQVYHGHGHIKIGFFCRKGGNGVMSFSEVSARDPIFYRWHQHIEDLIQQFKDKRLQKYSLKDFKLENGVKVQEINTIVDTNDASEITNHNLQNTLITLEEVAEIRHHRESRIRYVRMNHLPFKYQIKLENFQLVVKKIIIRIFLGLSKNDSDDIKDYDPQKMVEMDRFVHTLKGETKEVVERWSNESALTMKEKIITIKRLIHDIKAKKDSTTWCGYPHNLLIPRFPFITSRSTHLIVLLIDLKALKMEKVAETLCY